MLDGHHIPYGGVKHEGVPLALRRIHSKPGKGREVCLDISWHIVHMQVCIETGQV